jgi:hypothetical protein
VQGRAEILRAGKNVTTVEARLAGETLQAIAVGTFGVARASEVSAVPVQPPISGDRSIELPFIPGVVPAFLEHFAARWRAGSPPFTRVTERDHVVEVDMRDEGPTTEAHVLAIADFMPPLALAQLSRPVPGSTATWMLELFADRFDELALSGWRLDATLRSARDGYISQSVMLWGPDGVPVGIGHQSMLVFG